MDPGRIAALLELSRERDQWERLCARAYREGYRAAERAHADDYWAGVHDGILGRKRFEHQLVKETELELLRWGPGGREHFADARDGDFTGGPEAIERTRQAWLTAGFSLGPGPGWTHLGGRFVHGNPGGHRPCTKACYSYEPGWYRTEDAIAILQTLPGDYAEAIQELRREMAMAAA